MRRNQKLVQSTVGGRLRITAQLIRAEDSTRLFSKRYDREMTDILAVQDEIATDIANQLELRFTIRKKSTTDLEAHERFLEGRFH
jgi:adenylate cyclase